MFFEHAWYVAGWSSEFNRSLAAKKILGETVLLFRKQDGELTAISNVCPHRFAPLSMGELHGDTVVCGYHGLQFNSEGSCIHNPHGNGAIPSRAHLKKYAVFEKQQLAWIWPGDTTLADTGLIPDFPHLERPGFKTLSGVTTVNANYQLLADNILDPSHTQWVHKDFHKMEDFMNNPPQVSATEREVVSNYWMPNTKGPMYFMQNFEDPATPVDNWTRVTWQAPSVCLVDIGVTLVGHPETDGLQQIGTHIFTPISEHECTYYYAHTRNFRVDDVAVDASTRHWQYAALQEQDKPIIEACQSNMGEQDFESMRPLLLSCDIAPTQARRALKALIIGQAKDGKTYQRRTARPE